ncbi:MAG: caspase family protein [Zavarzinia sp.]|nr:caspase family protein [Zavarzinia sp.]
MAGGGLTTIPQPVFETGMHGAAINGLTVVKGGQIATVSDDKTIRLWDMASGRLNATLRVPVAPGPEGALHAIAASPSGGFVAVGGNTGFVADGTASLYVYNVDKQAWAGRISLSEPAADTINDLAFSPDAKGLAVATSDKRGLRLVDMKARTVKLVDADYRDAITRLAYAADGRLATASLDGAVRLYGADMKRLATYRAPAGLTPFDIAFSPDGATLAVSFLNGDRVALLGGRDLKPGRQLDGSRARSGHLSVVAWSADGATLMAAGTYGDQTGRKFLRRWHLADETATDIPASLDTVLVLAALPGGTTAWAAADPAWGLIGADGQPGPSRERATVDFRDQLDGSFQVSADGARVRFGLGRGGATPFVYDLLSGDYQPAEIAAAGKPASLVRLARWRNGTAPTLDGKPLALEANEISRSAALTANGRRLALGTDFGLKLYENGRLLWKSDLASPVWTLALAEEAGWIVAGLGDGSIRWFDIETGRPALMFFPHADGRRWLASTVEGFFDHGPESEKLFGYVVNALDGGKPKGADWISIDQVYSVFYRRDLLVAKLRRSGDGEIAAAAAKIGGVVAVVDRGLPPALSIVEICETGASTACRPPSADGQPLAVTTERIRLKYRAVDQGGGIGRVLVRLNGAVVEGGASASVAREGEQTGELGVELGHGPADIRLSAFNAAGEIEIDRDKQPGLVLMAGPRPPPTPVAESPVPAPPGAVAAPPAPLLAVGDPPVAGGRIFVVAIGVNRFQTPDIPPLVNAVADATGLAQALDGPSTRLTLLTDEQASRAAILDALDRLAADAGPDDTAVIFLAGHGVPIEGRYYFLPNDIAVKSREAIQTRGISQDEIIAALGRLRAWRAAVVLDTCFAGLLAVEDAVFRQTANDTVAGQLVRASGRFILAGAASKEEALDGVNGHGVFTGALIEGLGGLADSEVRGNRDKIVDVFEIGEFAKKTVPEIARRIREGHRQSPRWFFTGSDVFPLTRLGNGG